MPLPRELALTTEETEELLRNCWNMRIATLGPGSRINLAPLWFAWVDGRMYFYSRGQKIANLRRNPTATVLVDRNERFPELQGLMLHGRATVLEDADAEQADPGLAAAQDQMTVKYAGGHGAREPDYHAWTARGRHFRWVRFEPAGMVSWDNTKLPQR